MISFGDNLILGIALALHPGPVTIEILKRGLKNGPSESFKTAVGAFCAELAFFTLVYCGLAKINIPFLVKNALGLIGGGFLIFLAFQNFLDFKNPIRMKNKDSIYGNAFLSGFTITFFNPLNLFMWVGIIGGFFSQNTSLITSSAILLGILGSLFAYVLFSKVGKLWIDEKKVRYVSLLASIFLFFYGLKLIIGLLFPRFA